MQEIINTNINQSNKPVIFNKLNNYNIKSSSNINSPANKDTINFLKLKEQIKDFQDSNNNQPVQQNPIKALNKEKSNKENGSPLRVKDLNKPDRI